MICSRRFCDYNNYYTAQAGGNLDISYYRGVPYQRGYGIFTNLAKRYGVPVLKYLLKQGYSAGKDIFNDFREGKNISDSAKIHLKKRAATALKDIGEHIGQSGSGVRKKPKLGKRIRHRPNKRKSKSKGKVKSRRKKSKQFNKLNKDIFA